MQERLSEGDNAPDSTGHPKDVYFKSKSLHVRTSIGKMDIRGMSVIRISYLEHSGYPHFGFYYVFLYIFIIFLLPL